MLKIDYATGTGGSSADFTSQAKISKLLHKSCTVPQTRPSAAGKQAIGIAVRKHLKVINAQGNRRCLDMQKIWMRK